MLQHGQASVILTVCPNCSALPTEHEVYNHVARYAKPDDVIATWVTVQTVVVFWSLWWIACTYEGPLKWPVVLACAAIAGARLPPSFAYRCHHYRHLSAFPALSKWWRRDPVARWCGF